MGCGRADVDSDAVQLERFVPVDEPEPMDALEFGRHLMLVLRVVEVMAMPLATVVVHVSPRARPLLAPQLCRGEEGFVSQAVTAFAVQKGDSSPILQAAPCLARSSSYIRWTSGFSFGYSIWMPPWFSSTSALFSSVP